MTIIHVSVILREVMRCTSLLVDIFGNDVYNASPTSQAVALGWPNLLIWSTTWAVMLDIGGNDVYNGGEQAYAGGAFAFLINIFAFLINIFDVDDYSNKGKDWSLWTQGYFGIGIDMGGIRNLL